MHWLQTIFILMEQLEILMLAAFPSLHKYEKGGVRERMMSELPPPPPEINVFLPTLFLSPLVSNTKHRAEFHHRAGDA